MRPRLVIGFAAETDEVVKNAIAKRARKGADWIIANDVSADSNGESVMGAERNRVHLVSSSGVEDWPEMTKSRAGRPPRCPHRRRTGRRGMKVGIKKLDHARDLAHCLSMQPRDRRCSIFWRRWRPRSNSCLWSAWRSLLASPLNSRMGGGGAGATPLGTCAQSWHYLPQRTGYYRQRLSRRNQRPS